MFKDFFKFVLAMAVVVILSASAYASNTKFSVNQDPDVDLDSICVIFDGFVEPGHTVNLISPNGYTVVENLQITENNIACGELDYVQHQSLSHTLLKEDGDMYVTDGESIGFVRWIFIPVSQLSNATKKKILSQVH